MEKTPFVDYILKEYTHSSALTLDVGCGPALYKSSVKGGYIGTDISYELKGYIKADVYSAGDLLSFKPDSFDVIFIKSALYQMDRPGKCLDECYRILKPNGRLILFDYNRRTQRNLQISENNIRPCWTQWGLKKIVSEHGFKECRIMLPVTKEINAAERIFRLINEELRGNWAIVTGIK